MPLDDGRKEPWLDTRAVLALDEGARSLASGMPKAGASAATAKSSSDGLRQEPKAAPASSSDEPEMPSLPKELPNMLVQISLVARGAYLEGDRILSALDAQGLKLGKLQIYHRVDTTNRVIYSLASMVEPGIFPTKDMADFATPGITLFMQLPGPKEGLEAFQDMLDTATALAKELNAELQDPEHNLLRPQAIEHLRSQIQEHSRQLKLAQVRQQRARH